MTRTLFFFTALAAMLMGVTAALIRIELAYPGVSALFSTPDGTPDSARFNETAVLHALLAYLAVAMLGTYMSSIARAKGARWGGLCSWGAALAAATIAIGIGLSLLPPSPLGGPALPETVGWTLYPPLSDPTSGNLLASFLAWLSLDPMLRLYADLSQVFVIPAALALYLGAYALLSTEPGFGGLSIAGAILTFGVTGLATVSMLETGPNFAANLYLLLLLPLLACASIRLIDAAPPGVVILTLGIIAVCVFQMVLFLTSFSDIARGNQVQVVEAYTGPLGLAWFALPAALIFDRSSRLPDWMPWTVSAMVAVGLATWLIPLLTLGYRGQPMRYMDYAEAFAAQNLAATVGVAVFGFLYLAALIIIRRHG